MLFSNSVSNYRLPQASLRALNWFQSESESWYTVDGQLYGSGKLFDELAGVYKTKDDSYVRIHTNFPQ